jgi:hypothetical protein
MRQFNVLKLKFGFAGTTRGSPSLVNGVRLRTSSLRGSRVRIPPPAPETPAQLAWRLCAFGVDVNAKSWDIISPEEGCTSG